MIYFDVVLQWRNEWMKHCNSPRKQLVADLSVSLILIYASTNGKILNVFVCTHTNTQHLKRQNSTLIGTSNKWVLIGREGRAVMTGSVAVSVSLCTWIKRSQPLLYPTIHGSLQQKAQRGTPAVPNQTLLTKRWQQGAALCLYFVWGDYWEVQALQRKGQRMHTNAYKRASLVKTTGRHMDRSILGHKIVCPYLHITLC